MDKQMGPALAWWQRAWRGGAGLLVAGGTFAAIVACDTADSGPPAGTPLPVPVAFQAGQRVFAQYCNTCHPGGHRGAGPTLAGRVSESEVEATVRQGKGRMPAFGPDRISNVDLQSLAGYIETLK